MREADTAELFQNGKSLGKQACGKDTAFETQFHTVYEPGELVAVAYENGKEIGRAALRTAGKPAALELSAETYDTLGLYQCGCGGRTGPADSRCLHTAPYRNRRPGPSAWLRRTESPAPGRL